MSCHGQLAPGWVSCPRERITHHCRHISMCILLLTMLLHSSVTSSAGCRNLVPQCPNCNQACTDIQNGAARPGCVAKTPSFPEDVHSRLCCTFASCVWNFHGVLCRGSGVLSLLRSAAPCRCAWWGSWRPQRAMKRDFSCGFGDIKNIPVYCICLIRALQ